MLSSHQLLREIEDDEVSAAIIRSQRYKLEEILTSYQQQKEEIERLRIENLSLKERATYTLDYEVEHIAALEGRNKELEQENSDLKTHLEEITGDRDRLLGIIDEMDRNRSNIQNRTHHDEINSDKFKTEMHTSQQSTTGRRKANETTDQIQGTINRITKENASIAPDRLREIEKILIKLDEQNDRMKQDKIREVEILMHEKFKEIEMIKIEKAKEIEALRLERSNESAKIKELENQIKAMKNIYKESLSSINFKKKEIHKALHSDTAIIPIDSNHEEIPLLSIRKNDHSDSSSLSHPTGKSPLSPKLITVSQNCPSDEANFEFVVSKRNNLKGQRREKRRKRLEIEFDSSDEQADDSEHHSPEHEIKISRDKVQEIESNSRIFEKKAVLKRRHREENSRDNEVQKSALNPEKAQTGKKKLHKDIMADKPINRALSKPKLSSNSTKSRIKTISNINNKIDERRSQKSKEHSKSKDHKQESSTSVINRLKRVDERDRRLGHVRTRSRTILNRPNNALILRPPKNYSTEHKGIRDSCAKKLIPINDTSTGLIDYSDRSEGEVEEENYDNSVEEHDEEKKETPRETTYNSLKSNPQTYPQKYDNSTTPRRRSEAKHLLNCEPVHIAKRRIPLDFNCRPQVSSNESTKTINIGVNATETHKSPALEDCCQHDIAMLASKSLMPHLAEIKWENEHYISKCEEKMGAILNEIQLKSRKETELKEEIQDLKEWVAALKKSNWKLREKVEGRINK